VLAGFVRPLGVRDLRLPAFLALVVLGGALAARIDARRRGTALALALLAGPTAIGTVLGAPYALSLSALVAAWPTGRGRSGLASGLLAGAATALDHRATLAVPFLLLALGNRRAVARGLAAALAAYLLIVGPVALLDPAAFAARLGGRAAPGPGLGLFNLLAYRGMESSAGAFALAALAPLVLAALVLWLLKRPWPPLALAGIASLAGIVVAPALSPEAVAVPLLLLGLAAIEGTGEAESGGIEMGEA
jgi:uncharacterized membrane protein